MPHFTFPTDAQGMTLDVLVGLKQSQVRALRSAGRPIPAPIRLRAIIDTGADVSAVTPRALAPFGLTSVGSVLTITAGGFGAADSYEVGLSVPPPTGVQVPNLVRPAWIVIDLLASPPGIDALIGMDLLSECLLILDGPGGRFTIAF
jgi:hypothetical protein